MIRRPPRSTRPHTLFPYTTLFRSLLPSVQPLYDLVPNFQIDVPLRVNVPEDFGTDGHDLGVCGLALPVTSTPRMVAGMPETDDIIRCQLRPIDPADYDGKLGDAQLAQLAAIFPDGVRPEDRRVGKEGIRKCRSRWWTDT